MEDEMPDLESSETNTQNTEELPPFEPQVQEESDSSDLLHSFYYFKTIFEQSKFSMKDQLQINPTTSWKQIQKQFKNTKFPCINCKRRVNTIFTVQTQKVESQDIPVRKYLAICGDSESPCDFHIEFEIPISRRIDQEYLLTIEKVNQIQRQIIIAKNNVVFGMITPNEAVKQFEEFKQEMEKYNLLKEQYMNQLIFLINNPVKKKDLKEKLNEFYTNVSEYKTLVEKHIREDEPIETANAYFRDTLLPSSSALSELKYSTREVIEDTPDRKIYSTTEYDLSKLEIPSEIHEIKVNLGNKYVAPINVVVANKTNKSRPKKSKKNNKTVKTKEPPKKEVNMEKINDAMKQLLQKMIIEDRLTMTESEMYKEIKKIYRVSNLESKYGETIKAYFGKHIPIWMNEYDHIMDVLHNMAVSGEIKTATYKTIEQQLVRTNTEVDFRVFKPAIIDITGKYMYQLGYKKSGDDSDVLIGTSVPYPEWPPKPEEEEESMPSLYNSPELNVEKSEEEEEDIINAPKNRRRGVVLSDSD
jgi:hypothetical protein